MTYQKDQERKKKIFTWATIGVLILAVLPIVLFAVFSVVTAKNPPIKTSSSIEEPTLSRSEIRRLEREKKKAEEEAAKQTITQNQPVITTETMPQMGQFPGMGFGPGMSPMDMYGGFGAPGMGFGGMGGFGGPEAMGGFGAEGGMDFGGMGGFGGFGFGMDMGAGFGGPGGFGMGFGQDFDPANMPQFDPSQFQGMQGGY